MKEICVNSEAIAFCGLYCGACRSYLKGKCPGCTENEKASWCKARKCCIEHSYRSCADCLIVDNPGDCKKLNNFIAKLFALVFRSDRMACLASIKEKGYDDYAREMAEKGIMTIKR
ncbi:DUF3795 domain-containing protein [Candidatus Latescibacterota bacterium]